MKKLAKTLTLVLLVAVLALSLVACGSSYKKIEKALVAEGYAVIETTDEYKQMQEDSEVPVTIHLLSNKDSLKLTDALKLNVVMVLEFKTTDKMVEFYQENEEFQALLQDIKDDGTAEEFYNKLVEKGLANGNCMVVSTNPLVFSDVCEIVKGA